MGVLRATDLKGNTDRPAWVWVTEVVRRGDLPRVVVGEGNPLEDRGIAPQFAIEGGHACECEPAFAPDVAALHYLEGFDDMEPVEHDLWECPRCEVVVTRLDATPERCEVVVIFPDELPDGAEDLLQPAAERRAEVA
jgi:hypothetical protein